MINGHGDDALRYGGKIVANFSSNVYNDVNHEGLMKYLSEEMSCISAYPEPEPYSLESMIAQDWGLQKENICVTNGATEAIYLIAQRYRGVKSVIVVPTFSEYEDACRIHCPVSKYVGFLNSLEKVIASGDVDLVWLCNPNNPTGLVHSRERLLQMIGRYVKSVFIIDQSYEYFTQKPVIEAAEVSSCSNLILLHSMTKRYAIPGLRLGYITGSEKIVESIKSIRMPWSVNALAVRAGKYLISGRDVSCAKVENLLEESRWLAEEINAIDIDGRRLFEAMPSDTHYMLVKINSIPYNSHEIKEILAHKYGLLIRDASNFHSLDDSYFRIATQKHEENLLLIAALMEIGESSREVD